MRTFLSIFLFVLYTIATSGAVVSMHYCGEKLASWEISMHSTESHNCCDNEEMACSEEQKSCCQDDVLTLKIQKEYKLPVLALQLTDFSVAVLPTPLYIHNNNVSIAVTPYIIPFSNAPPGNWQGRSLFTLYQSWKLFDVIEA